ncbi:PAAR domain-containing protein [Brevibacillus sp. SYSU BS000544]|uniref:PAAR domain-containing protein n=1 Tax=Brevibacillus sp. SYSU BS000544 TaxID=3416443 RepID=UPI003CE47FA0
MTSHGTLLGPGPGSFNVYIGGRPAWRATTDFHACPAITGTPHGGGVVPIGSPTVWINNLPAVRQGDIIAEAGPPNTIMMGESTVLIG